MVKALFDTNILIDYLNEVGKARTEINRYNEASIGIVTWIEVMVGANPDVEAPTRAFLARFSIVHLDEQIADEAVALRRRWRLKVPDAIIWASARVRGHLLVSRNTKDFPHGDPGIRIPYKI